ncbi:MAG: hypothetical protein LBH18_07350 [Spirochaetaceae bacterium]|jgi:hypothetical protein|nr:hypothetical protein [Spirochaetaceae bacterium]
MKHLRTFTRTAAIVTTIAALCALAFVGCETDSGDDYDEPFAWQDRGSKNYNIKVPEANERGGITASPNPAKLGTPITINYIPPLPPENGDAARTQNQGVYTVTSITGTYAEGQKTLNIVKNSEGGGGGLEVLHARNGRNA